MPETKPSVRDRPEVAEFKRAALAKAPTVSRPLDDEDQP